MATTDPPVTSWHAATPDDVLRELGTDRGGLTTATAAQRRAEYGANVIPRPGVDGPLRVFVRQIHNPLIWVLIASGTVAILLGKPIDGAVVLGVVIANAAIGFVQEFRASKAIEALTALVPEQATVLRDGQRLTISAADLVPGDIAFLASGDKVPADLRLLDVRSLQVDESTLTGESVPADKAVACVTRDAAVADRRTIAHGGTLVTYGTATAVVVATGSSTELGKISSLLEGVAGLQTPLTRAMARVAAWLTIVISVVAALLVVVGLARGYPLVDAVVAAIALAVGAIPEGLPAIITIALAIGVQRMARRHAVIRKLPAVEALGSTTIVCSDKTGTLTRNEMTVQELWTPPGGTYRLSGVGYSPLGALTTGAGTDLLEPPDDVVALARAGVLCSDATVTLDEDAWRVHGDPTEGALIVAARKLGLDPDAERTARPREDSIPFESEHRYMATLHGRELLVKGAPEVVLDRCVVGDRGAAQTELVRMAAQGMRVLAFARATCAGAGQIRNQVAELELLGFAGMIDPPRPEAVAAVAACGRAGISVKMITGDHPETATAIGRQLGLQTTGAAVTGAELAGLDDDALRDISKNVNVFARVAPEHKLRLVTALQAQGEVVAMTGDGVNDAPALKQANIGVAMGITGTAVSKESADMILTDDNFASIEAAVEEGRRVYDNLIKALAFVLPTNLSFALVILLSVAFFPIESGVPLLPMEPVQLLWINLVATVTLALPLAFEVGEPDAMTRPPRPPTEPILSRFVLIRTAVVAGLMTAGAIGLFLWEYYLQADRDVPQSAALAEAQTMSVTTVILFQIFYLLNCRSLRDSVFTIGVWSNAAVFAGIAAIVVLQLGFVYLPFMNDVFGSARLPLAAWAEAAAVALLVLPVIGVEKRRRRRQRRGNGR